VYAACPGSPGRTTGTGVAACTRTPVDTGTLRDTPSSTGTTVAALTAVTAITAGTTIAAVTAV